MNILGINYIFHDTSACIVKDGRLSVAIEEERLTRTKHSQTFPVNAINSSFKYAGLVADDIDHIAVSINPEKHISDKLAHASSLDPNSDKFLQYEFERLQERHLGFWNWYNQKWKDQKHRPDVHFIDHHLSHIGGSYFVSPWNDAALLSIDGWGEWTSTWLGEAQGNNISCFKESMFPNSLGLFYSVATEYCGFKVNYDEGKTMGLAPTGNSERFYREINQLVDISDEGEVRLDMKWFNFDQLSGSLFNKEFEEFFGLARKTEEEFKEHHLDIAAAFQKVLERAALQLCHVLERKTDSRNLVLAGGVALNSVMNGAIIQKTRFDDIYVMPGAGDNGTCIGAAHSMSCMQY